MKTLEIKKARRLRYKGWSVRAITKEIKCSKSSVSKWVRGISLTPEQIEQLKSNQDKARAKAANHPNGSKLKWAKIREDIINNAEKDIFKNCSLDILRVVGASLYWAEGYKATVNVANFSNTDPRMVSLMMRFFREICNVPEEKFRAVLHIHPHLDREKAKKFWAQISGIPLKQFHKTQLSLSKATKHKRDTLPLGTFAIIVCDVRVLSKIKGWIKGIEAWSNLGAVSSVG